MTPHHDPTDTARLADWIDAYDRPSHIWYAKRLSGNDTLANRTHQAGPYIQRTFLLARFPSLRPDMLNPFTWFELVIDSHQVRRPAKVIWYNNKLRGQTRNEARVTNLGGASSPLLDPESTGALTVFAFRQNEDGDCDQCHVWICESLAEESVMEDRIGPLEPGRPIVWSAGRGRQDLSSGPCRCRLDPHEIPADWMPYPPGKVVTRKSVALLGDLAQHSPGARLVARKDCEFEVYKSLEEAFELPGIRHGFDTIESFLTLAKSMVQRRKSRAGRSLELQVREILLEEGLREGLDFSYDVESEPGRKPDFLFPTQAHYRDPAYPTAGLRMLAVKTSTKDRWRQILNEADRIPIKHLLTVQDGITPQQYREMVASRVQLVVPQAIHRTYEAQIRPDLMTFRAFISETKALQHFR